MYWSLNPGAIGIRLPLPEILPLARATGFAGVDINIAEVADLVAQQGLGAVQALFREAGVRPGSWGLPVDWRGPAERWRAGLADLPRLADLAVALGARRCVTWVPPASDERPFAENFAWHVERLQPIAEVLRAAGCRLGLEFIGTPSLRRTRRYPFLYTQDGMLDLARAIGTGTVGLLLDSWHWSTSGGTLADLHRLTAADIVAVHLNDAPAGVPLDALQDNARCLPGETGVIDLAGFLRALQAVGYDGPVAVEPFNQTVSALPPAEAARATAESLRRVWQRAGLPLPVA